MVVHFVRPIGVGSRRGSSRGRRGQQGEVMYWHMYVIVAICRESERLERRLAGKEGGERRAGAGRGKVDVQG